MAAKKYGLILSEKKPKTLSFQASRNVFGIESDSDDESNKRPAITGANQKTKTKILREKAKEEDPTVYQYDEIYDEMTSQKIEKRSKDKEQKKPRYIENLLKTANKRKIENERRIERQIQKEREKEGDEFKDKEVFVTSAYKQKLEDMRLEEEKEKYEEYLESVGDVTKQKDLGGFYRHLYEQKLGNTSKENQNREEISTDIKCENLDSNEVKNKEKDSVTDKSKLKRKVSPQVRNYRKRKISQEHSNLLSDGEIEDSEEEINRVNLDDIKSAKKTKNSENIDADSDFSLDGSSSDEDMENKKQSITQIEPEKLTEESKVKIDNINLKNEASENSIIVQKEIKPKIDIWKKRTVGEVFELALKRYYERKAARGS